MGAEDTWDKLQKIAELVILKALVFSSNRL